MVRNSSINDGYWMPLTNLNKLYFKIQSYKTMMIIFIFC